MSVSYIVHTFEDRLKDLDLEDQIVSDVVRIETRTQKINLYPMFNNSNNLHTY